MVALRLEALPPIVLERICVYLAQCDDYRRCSLRNFSLASRACASVAAAQLFCQIQLTVQSRDKIQHDLQRWSEVLSVNDRFRYVRRLKLSQFTSQSNDKRQFASIRQRDEEGGELDDGDAPAYFDTHDFCQPRGVLTDSRSANNIHPQQQEVLDGAWQAFAHFIDQLSGLEDLMWATRMRMPRCILLAIHAIRCRLHMYSFSLSSLIHPRDHHPNVDPDEFAIATSPCLHSIVVPFYDYDTNGNVNYNQEAVLRMVSMAAPNLANVWMVLRPPGASIALRNAFRTPRPIWPGFFAGIGTTDKPLVLGNLRNLVIDDSGLSSMQIIDWGRHTDFTKLRCLAIHWSNDSRGVIASLQTIGNIAKDGQFQSLKSLALSIPDSSSERMQEALVQTLKHLTPLQRLDLDGFISMKASKAVLSYHGNTLHNLRLIPRRPWGSRRPMVVFSGSVMQRLVQQCPNLEQVELPINRTQSDRRETAAYRALSRLPRLRHASLILQFSIESIEEEEENDDDGDDHDDGEEGEEGEDDHVIALSRHNVPLTDIVKSFTNGAIDSSLALSIFDLISAGKTLRYLKLKTMCDRGPVSYDEDFIDILTWIGRSWACILDVHGKVSVRELGKEQRLRAGEELSYIEDGLYLAAWNDIWPQGTLPWWDSWKSLPLSPC